MWTDHTSMAARAAHNLVCIFFKFSRRRLRNALDGSEQLSEMRKTTNFLNEQTQSNETTRKDGWLVQLQCAPFSRTVRLNAIACHCLPLPAVACHCLPMPVHTAHTHQPKAVRSFLCALSLWLLEEARSVNTQWLARLIIVPKNCWKLKTEKKLKNCRHNLGALLALLASELEEARTRLCARRLCLFRSLKFKQIRNLLTVGYFSAPANFR